MKQLGQTLRRFTGAVVLLLSGTLASSAQLPSQALRPRSVVEQSTSALPPFGAAHAPSIEWPRDSTLIARMTTFDHLTRVTGLPRSGHTGTTNQPISQALSFRLPRWSLERALASMPSSKQASTQAAPMPQLFALLPSKEQKNREFAQRLPRSFTGKFQNFSGPSGVSPLPSVPGLVQTPSTNRFQIGYEFYRWEL